MSTVPAVTVQLKRATFPFMCIMNIEIMEVIVPLILCAGSQAGAVGGDGVICLPRWGLV